MTKRGPIAPCWIRYFERRSRDKNILGGEGLYNTKYPVAKCCLKQVPKVTSIGLLSKSKTQLVNRRKQKVAFSPGTAHSPEIQSYRAWWGAASPILNDTPVVCIYIYIYIYKNIYTSYNRTHIRMKVIFVSKGGSGTVPTLDTDAAKACATTMILTVQRRQCLSSTRKEFYSLLIFLCGAVTEIYRNISVYIATKN